MLQKASFPVPYDFSNIAGSPAVHNVSEQRFPGATGELSTLPLQYLP